MPIVDVLLVQRSITRTSPRQWRRASLGAAAPSSTARSTRSMGTSSSQPSLASRRSALSVLTSSGEMPAEIVLFSLFWLCLVERRLRLFSSLCSDFGETPAEIVLFSLFWLCLVRRRLRFSLLSVLTLVGCWLTLFSSLCSDFVWCCVWILTHLKTCNNKYLIVISPYWYIILLYNCNLWWFFSGASIDRDTDVKVRLNL